MQPRHFDRVWDATAGFNQRSKLPKKNITGLIPGDLVQIECTLQRYTPSEPMTGTWNSWRTSFQLDTITRLYAATANFPDEQLSDYEAAVVDEDADLYAQVSDDE